MRLNNKGFTLVEVLAVVVILGVIGGIAGSSVLSSINSSKEASYKLMVNNIVIASENLYKEVEFGNTIYEYSNSGVTTTKYSINSSKEIKTNLQTLVSNGFLTGSENKKQSETNKNKRTIENPKIKESDIGTCVIIIKKVDNNKYQVNSTTSSNSDCPTTSDYSKYKNGVK